MDKQKLLTAALQLLTNFGWFLIFYWVARFIGFI
jgi:hypothetical protein